jgi:hypothetical protein
VVAATRDRFLAWLVTGPLARLAGFACELAIALWRFATGQPQRED